MNLILKYICGDLFFNLNRRSDPTIKPEIYAWWNFYQKTKTVFKNERLYSLGENIIGLEPRVHPAGLLPVVHETGTR